MGKTHLARTNKIFPLGASQDFIDRRDEEIAEQREEEAAPASIVRNSPIYLAQVNLNKHLQQQIASLKAEIEQLKAGGPTKKKRKIDKDNKPGRRIAEPIRKEGSVTYWSMAYVAQTKGLHQSNVSRQMKKKGIKPKMIGGIYYIPAAQAENIERRP